MTLSPKVFGVTTKPTDPTPAVGQQTFFAPECVTPVTYPWLNEFIQIFLNSQIYLGIANTPNDENALKKMFEKILEGLIATGANTPRKLIDRFGETLSIFDFGAIGDGIEDDADMDAFLAACASGKTVIIPGNGKIYNISGTFTLASGTHLIFQNNPVINLTMNGAVGDRGIWFPGGSTGCQVTGHATVYAENTVSPADGSLANVFQFGKYVYGSNVDATLSSHHKIDGIFNIITPNIITGNIKAIGIYGWSENILIRGVKQIGSNNFCFVLHWGQNISIEERGETPISQLPTKTWHPHNVVLEDCEANSQWPNCNSFTTSAVGKVTFIRCIDNGTPEGFNLFAGDLGYTLQQNLGKYPYHRIKCESIESNNPVNYAMSVDQQTNPVGIFLGAPLWTGADKGNGGYVYIDGFDISIAEADTKIAGIAVTGVDRFVGKNIRIIEKDNTNTTRALQFYGCNFVRLEDLEMKVMQGCIVRNCGTVIFDNADIERFQRQPDLNNYGITFGSRVTGDPEDPDTILANSTVDGAVALGATQITLDDATLVAGAGGYIVYGSNRVKMLSSSFAGIGTQIIKVEPMHFTIPDNASVSIVVTVQKAVVRSSNFKGWAKHILLTGDTGAEVANVSLVDNSFLYGGVYDVETGDCKKVNIMNNFFNHGGQRTTATDKRGILLGDNVRGFSVLGNHFGENCDKLRYLVFVDDNALDGQINDNIFKSYNGGVANPACIYRDLSNVVIGNSNFYATGLTKIYPTLHLSFTPVFQGSSTAGTPVGTFNASYTRQGNLVYISVRANFTALTGMVGNLEMIGLPFNVSGSQNKRGGINVGYITGKNTAGDILGGYFSEGTNKIIFSKLNANNMPWAIADMTSTMGFFFEGFYFTDQ